MENINSTNNCCQPNQAIQSAVDFGTSTRAHIAINISHIKSSLPFYMQIFNEAPTKLKGDYARFEPKNPPVNFTLNQHPNNLGKSQYLGIELDSKSELDDYETRITQLNMTVEKTANGIKASDPDGHIWEIFYDSASN